MLRKMILAVGLLQTVFGMADFQSTVKVVEFNGQKYVDVQFSRQQGDSLGAIGIGTLISRMRYSGLANVTQNYPSYEVQDEVIYARISSALPKSAPDEIRARFQLSNEFNAGKYHSSFSFLSGKLVPHTPQPIKAGLSFLIIRGLLAKKIHQHIIRGGKYSTLTGKDGIEIRASSDLSCLLAAQTETVRYCAIGLPSSTVFISNP